MTITKKVISVLCLAALLLSMLCIPVFANNHTDRDFTFIFYPSAKSMFTLNGYEKKDDSGTYLSYTDGNAQSCRFSVYGGNEDSQFMCTIFRNETKNDHVFIARGSTGLIRQYVYENRAVYNRYYPYTYLKGFVEVVDGGIISSAEGKWSPDSVGSLPYFN